MLIGECTVPVLGKVAEQILKALLPDEDVTLEVQKDVALGGFRQAGQTEACFQRKQFKACFATLAGLHLNPRLLTHAGIGAHRSAIGPPIQRERHGGQRLHRCDASLRKLVDLELRYARDETEMVVIPAPLFARRPPAACYAVLVRIGIAFPALLARSETSAAPV